MLLVLAVTAGLGSSSLSVVVYGRKEWSLYTSALHMAELPCVSSSLCGQSWKELGVVDYCLVFDELVEHAEPWYLPVMLQLIIAVTLDVF